MDQKEDELGRVAKVCWLRFGDPHVALAGIEVLDRLDEELEGCNRPTDSPAAALKRLDLDHSST